MSRRGEGAGAAVPEGRARTMRYHCVYCGFEQFYMLHPKACRFCGARGSMKAGSPGVRYTGRFMMRGNTLFKVQEPSQEFLKLAEEAERRLLKSKKRRIVEMEAPSELQAPVEEKMEESVDRPRILKGKRNVHGGVDLGVGTWNINHMNSAEEKMASISRLFAENPWLDVLVLQEINKAGKAELEKYAKTLKTYGLSVRFGEELESLYPRYVLPKEKKKRGESSKPVKKLDALTGKWEYWPGQTEWYPIVYRSGAFEVTGDWTFPKKVHKKQPFEWAKHVSEADLSVKDSWKKKFTPPLVEELKEDLREQYVTLNETYPLNRPIVVYDLRMNGQTVHLGIVHTSPEGQGLGRKGEFEQVLPFFERMRKGDDEHWILAGDYYVDPEASVLVNTKKTERAWDDLFHVTLSNMGLKVAIPISATNQSHVNNLKVTQEDIERGYIRDYVQDEEGNYRVNKRADFFVVTPGFAFRSAGLFSPERGLLPVDPNHNALKWWRKISDHTPVGAIFCSSSLSKKWLVNQQLLESVVKEERDKAWLCIWEFHKQALDELGACHRPLVALLPLLDGDYLLLAKRLCVLVNDALASPTALMVNRVPWTFDEAYETWKAQTSHVGHRSMNEFFDLCSALGWERLDRLPEQLQTLVRLFRRAFRALEQLAIQYQSFDFIPEKQTYEGVNPKGKGTLPSLFPGSNTTSVSPPSEKQEGRFRELLGRYLKSRFKGGGTADLGGASVTTGRANQFQVPGGRTACSPMAVLAIAQLFSSDGAVSTDSIDTTLLEGTVLYHRMRALSDEQQELMEAIALSLDEEVDSNVLLHMDAYFNPANVPDEELTSRGIQRVESGTVSRGILLQQLSLFLQHERVGLALVLGGYTVSITRVGARYFLFDSHGWLPVADNAFMASFTSLESLLFWIQKMVDQRLLFEEEVGVTAFFPL